jgi:hypothetical protein
VKRVLALAAALSLSAGVSLADTTTQRWKPGWDVLGEPLNLTTSSVKWSLSTARKLTVTYTLIGATPNKLHQVGLHVFCATFPTTFGQFPVGFGGAPAGTCTTITRQGVTRALASVEFGVVTTDRNGKGSFKVVVGPVAPGVYDVEFNVRVGAGCNLAGGGGAGLCPVDFQSPGPYGTATTIIVP